ncbi:MAG: hypothetical protein RMK31_08800, partial [Candidatus Caldarchaeum sp.]|nr:hypothetical protein [Candidatus Caldarchaeum sp.]
GVSIDRDFGGQRPGLLYTEEFVPPGTEWNFRMEVLNIDFPSNQSSGDERVYLLDSLVKTLKTVGLQVGARRSVGAGLIKLRQARWERYSPVNGMLEKIAEGAL